MQKFELIDEVASRTGRAKVVVREILDATADVTRAALARKEGVFLFGLGKLTPSRRGEKKARDLHKGTVVMVPARTVALFKPSESLAAAANSAA